ncbi:MAG: PHP domain-containing protein [Firmicutes bacterium]|nr:PHP domain-containing protein [Bacillota bacterium]
MNRLNSDKAQERLAALNSLFQSEKKVPKTGNVNNHVHTFYSFSPYSPSKAVWLAYQAGLSVVGIMDHDSVSGADEFVKAGEIVGIATTCGVEIRADFSKTVLAGKRINNPDQKGIAYLAVHAIPHKNFSQAKAFLAPYLKERGKRNEKMVEKINSVTKESALRISYANDVLPLSKHNENGSVTERHLLFALAKKLYHQFGRGADLILWLANEGINIDGKTANNLTDLDNAFFEYDLLGVLKGHFAEKIYIPAQNECPSVADVVDFSKQINAILAYAYLGDVQNSVTGDKKPQSFEDEYLEQLFDELNRLGFNALTYMPSRNTKQQLKRIRSLCERHNLMQISGEDINSPRQSFVCEALSDPEYANLVKSAWRLVEHERKA